MLSSVSPSNQVFSVIAESPSDAEILLAFKKSATTQSEGAIASVRCRIEDRNGIRVGVIDQLLDLASPEAPFDQARIGVFFDLVEESVTRLRAQGAAAFFAPKEEFPDSFKKKFNAVGFPSGKDRFTNESDLESFLRSRPHPTRIATNVAEPELSAAHLPQRTVFLDRTENSVQTSVDFAEGS